MNMFILLAQAAGETAGKTAEVVEAVPVWMMIVGTILTIISGFGVVGGC